MMHNEVDGNCEGDKNNDKSNKASVTMSNHRLITWTHFDILNLFSNADFYWNDRTLLTYDRHHDLKVNSKHALDMARSISICRVSNTCMCVYVCTAAGS